MAEGKCSSVGQRASPARGRRREESAATAVVESLLLLLLIVIRDRRRSGQDRTLLQVVANHVGYEGKMPLSSPIRR